MSPFTINSSTFTTSGAGRAASVLRIIQGQRSSMSRLLLVAVLLVLAIPVAVLMTLAALIAGVAVGGLFLAHRLMRWLKQLLPRNDGRENVRVVRRVE